MKVFILGGTGSIGTGLVRELTARNHDVTGLSRSVESDQKLQDHGITPLRGDITQPNTWANDAATYDAVIHVAATFDERMNAIDDAITSELIEAAKTSGKVLRFLYTGGCWLYGETGDAIATEDTPFNPLSSFSWMITGGQKLLASPYLSTTIIHPAMVYHEDGGVFDGFLSAAQEGSPIEIWGSAQTRWPIVERSDLARAYCDLLDHPKLTGHFNVTSQDSVYVEEIVRAIADHYEHSGKTVTLDVEDLVKEYGAWAKGPTIDQQMSSNKLQTATDWKPLYTDFRKSPLFE